MKFDVTPEEAQPQARAIIRHFTKHGMRVRIEKPAWDAAPYRTTLVAERGGRHVLVEAQGSLSYSRSLRDLMVWIAVNRHYAELYIAIDEHAALQVSTLQEMKADGVGLFLVDGTGNVIEHQRAKNPALVITPDPTLNLGAERLEVQQSIRKFNDTDRKDGLRDMCEIVERLTEGVGVRACRKGWLKIPEEKFREKDWASQINELARTEAYHSPCAPLVKPALKDDLHSFRGGRNLIDHKVRTRREDTSRQKQFAERMMQGPRLVAELISIKRKIT